MTVVIAGDYFGDYFINDFATDFAAKPRNNKVHPCNINSMAISKPGSHKLDAGKLFIMSTPIKIEIAAESASQIHSLKWRC